MDGRVKLLQHYYFATNESDLAVFAVSWQDVAYMLYLSSKYPTCLRMQTSITIRNAICP